MSDSTVYYGRVAILLLSTTLSHTLAYAAKQLRRTVTYEKRSRFIRQLVTDQFLIDIRPNNLAVWPPSASWLTLLRLANCEIDYICNTMRLNAQWRS